MKNYKILLFNIGYFSGLDGSWFDYLFKFYRYIFPSKRVVNKIAADLNKIIVSEKPDIICLIEIRKKQIKHILNRLNKHYKFYDFEMKYLPNGIADVFPVLKNYCNGFMAKEKINFKKFFIKNGFKKLVYEIEIGGKLKVLLFHFALGKDVRARQFLEIKEIAKDHHNTIVCGDFNIFKGVPELSHLLKDYDFKICQKTPTFPAHNPKKAIDLAIASKNLKVKAKAIPSQISDHLPVILEVNI